MPIRDEEGYEKLALLKTVIEDISGNLHAVWWDDNVIILTATEFSMLLLLMKQPKRVFSREVIMQTAYQNNVYVSDRTIDSHIRHIRQKFSEAGCDSVIETQHGVGYRLGKCD